MISRLKRILTYYDSEPTEITQGIIWLVFFPIIYTVEHGLNLFLVCLSIVIGYCTLHSVAYLSLSIRKTMAFAVFLFSIVTVIMYLFVYKQYTCPTHWGWLLISFSAFFNLRRITNHYYNRQIKK